MQNPYAERFETIESDIIDIKESMTGFSDQLSRLSDWSLTAERHTAEALLRIHLLWALIYLTRIKDRLKNNSVAEAKVESCIRKARESARGTLTDISCTSNPFDSFSSWHSDCRRYFNEKGFAEVFPDF